MHETLCVGHTYVHNPLINASRAVRGDYFEGSTFKFQTFTELTECVRQKRFIDSS